MVSNILPNCAHCPLPLDERICRDPEGKGPGGCPSLNKGKLIEEVLVEYSKKEIAEFARQASIQEGQCYANRDRKPYIPYPTKPRIEEICEFAHKMRYTRLGLVFCVGLRREGELVAQILEAKGFEVVSVVCKVGSIPKEEIGVKDDEKVRVGEYESMCNPILQAKIINDEETHFNVVMGLCVGHDSLFFKYAEAPTTVLVAKDRVSGHNPMGAIYTSGSYYSRLRQKGS
jgi:uncharacterized metal-binding protein